MPPRPPDPSEVRGEPASREAQLQGLLQTAQSESQGLREQLDSLQKEFEKAKALLATPEPSSGIVAELQPKLKAAEEKAASLELLHAESEKKWKLAEQKAALLAEKAIAQAKEFEAAMQRRTGLTPQPNQSLKLIAAALIVAAGLGGYGVSRFIRPNDNTKTQNEDLKRQIEDLNKTTAQVKLDAEKAKQDAKAEVDAANKAISDLNAAQAAQKVSFTGQIASTRQDLASARIKLNEEIAKGHSTEEQIAQEQAKRTTANQRVQQLETDIKSRDLSIVNLRTSIDNLTKLKAPRGSSLIWAGNVTGKQRVDTACIISAQDGRIPLKTVGGRKDQANGLSFEVAGTGRIEVRLSCP